MNHLLVITVFVSFISLALSQYSETKEDPDYSYHGSQHYGGNRRYGGGYPHSRYGYKYYKKCPKLDDPENGDVKLSGIRPGSKAVHSCDEGFILTGKKVRVCQRDGTWSDEAPTCEPVDCGNPDDADPNGSVDVGETTFRNTATYSCNEGYLLDTIRGGSEVVTCLASGEWSDTAPACRPVDCGQPPQEDINGDSDFDETTFGNTVTYTCNEGYELESGGDEVVLECLASGEWSGSAPVCNPVNCGEPPAPNSNGAINIGTTTFRSVRIYSCNVGYILDQSNGGSQYISCQSDRQWSGFAPNCERVDCGFIPTPQNGKVDFVEDTQLGSQAQFSCIRGYRLVGSSVRTCEANGDWSSTQPSCEKIVCPELKAPKFGKVLVSGQCVDDYARYRCSYRYSLVGDARRVCQEDGTWSGTAPTCKEKYIHEDKYGYGGYDYGHGRDHYDD